MAIIAVLLALSQSGWGVVSGMELKAASDSIADAISIARQHSSSLGRETRVVFFREAENGSNLIRGFQVQETFRKADGTVSTKGITRKNRLPDSVILDEDDSLLVADQGEWQGLEFRPGGRPKDLSQANNYLVLHPKSFAGKKPANYIVIQVNARNGRVQKYQP